METDVSPTNSVPDEQDLEQQLAQRTAQLESALAHAQALYDNAPCGYVSFDRDLKFVKVNQTLRDWLGYSADALHERNLLGFVDSSQANDVQRRFDRFFNGEDSDPIELELRCHDGTRFQALCTSVPVVNEDGEFVCTNTTVVDITDRKAAEQRQSSHSRFLQTITDRIPVQLAYYDKDLICRFANAAHASRCGKLPGDMIGAHMSDLVHPDLLPVILPHVADALSGSPQTFEAERDAATGNRHCYEIHYIPDHQMGSVEGIFVELHDITERRRTEEFVLEANRDLEERVKERTAELFKSEQRYRLMVDAIHDYCVYFVDETGSVTEWSDSAQRMHGFARDRILGQHYRQLLAASRATDEDDVVDADEVLKLAMAHGQWETRGWRLRDDGSRFWAHTILTALRNEEGELQGLSAITRDMTAAKSLEDVMNDLNRELEKRVAERTQQLVAANKDLDVFSHMVSHDLRAPLRHINSFLTLLIEDMGEVKDPAIKQYLDNISSAAKRMATMIEGLLEYARLGRVAIESQPVPLAPLVEGVIGHLKQENAERNISWQVEGDLPVVRGDAMLLAEVFTNLLNNSVKYTRRETLAEIKIGWQISPVGGRTFYVHDNGVGFDLEKATNLFVMFQRQHHSMDFEGNGTGLALSQRIIERHGGRIWAETSPGEGCTFYFTLPFDGLEPELEFPQSAMAELAA
ncbi:PAS domain S-box protein [Hydrogenophaga sp. 5NK40-0174]|uniref:PAS domain-containing sensor histidine kinase n=1 Tax=Hydrogenophaga sp. 5NK40-0174 TaxID=3127649 RepID=UPI00310AC392